VQTSYMFKTSVIRQRRNNANQKSMADMSFRLVNLRAAVKNGEVIDPQAIREAALELDGDLDAWGANVPPGWGYTTIDASEAPVGTCFEGKRHMYSNLWYAKDWNSWRILRILVNQIVIQNEARWRVPDSDQKSIALSIIREMSIGICISTASFTGSPRARALIRPLYIVSEEKLNAPSVRFWAVKQLRRINVSMGIRQAGLLADTVSQSLNESPRDFACAPSHLLIPRRGP